MKILLILLLIPILCFGAATRQLNDGNTLNITSRIHETSWYKLPYWDHNGYPKYSGALGTYTAKHIPIAVNGSGVDYYTFSENSSGDLNIYIADSLGNKTIVRTIENVIDPHDNAVVNYWDGYIWVVAAARGSKRIGYSYRSKYKNDISEFIQVGSGYWAYPHLWEKALLYTRYTTDNIRELYSRTVNCDQKLVSGGHYNISFYDGQTVHMVYNWHENSNLDMRTNLYYMKSDDGCVWKDKNDNILTLPLSEFDNQTLIHSTPNKYTYLKDIDVINGEVNILAVVSDSFYPDEGNRYLHKFTLITDTLITEVGHNYNTGGFIDGYIVTPTFGSFGHAGGDVEVFDLDGTHQLKSNFSYMYNYCRKVINGAGCYISESQSSIENNGAYVRKITIE